jgi:hypothetical protein
VRAEAGWAGWCPHLLDLLRGLQHLLARDGVAPLGLAVPLPALKLLLLHVPGRHLRAAAAVGGDGGGGGGGGSVW